MCVDVSVSPSGTIKPIHIDLVPSGAKQGKGSCILKFCQSRACKRIKTWDGS